MKLGIEASKWIIWILVSIGLISIPFIFFENRQSTFQLSAGVWFQSSLLETKYLYILHHALAFIPVFIFGIVFNLFSFRDVFIKEYWKPLSVLAILYIGWDMVFTYLRIWGFNETYIIGIKILGLPIEEIAWFLVIPFCSLFTYEVFKRYNYFESRFEALIKGLVLLVLVILYIVEIDKIYTSISVASCIIVVGYSWIWGLRGFALFLVAYGVILIPMILFNGMLTGLFTKEGLVVYNPEEFSGNRIFSFPMEDMAFGFSFLYGILCLRDIINK
ncbi:MAG: lycopene cyclase domain-containing protein [Saprospiraceae bacterium]|nr:lycopene cyclase domain-containing protein [Saprospiraceae bacterium]